MIEYCLGNVDRPTRDRLCALDVPTQEHRCLQRCGECWEGAILVVDGILRQDATHTALLEDLEAA